MIVSLRSAIAIAAVVASPAAAQAPALNHVYVVLDQATFDAIRRSRAVGDLLGRSDGGLPDYAPPPPDSDRIFFRGRQTYLELFAPKNRFDEPVGKVGIGLGEDDADRFAALADRWRAACPAGFARSTTSYRRVEPPVPWYDSAQCDATAARPDLSVWAMVYRPEFHRWQAGPAAAPRITRRDILAARHGRFDVASLAIDVPPDLFATLVPQLQAAGMRRSDRGGVTRLRGDGWEMRLRKAGNSARLTALGFSASGAARERLGTARLRAARNGVATITFGTPSGKQADR